MPFTLHSYPRAVSWAFGLVGVTVFIFLIYAWMVQARQDLTCEANLNPKDKWNGYQQIELKRQHPTEPVFEGEYFFVSKDDNKRSVSLVTITRSEGRNYGASNLHLKTVWDNLFSGLRPDPQRLDLINLSSLHQYFPLDSAHFNFTIKAEPNLGTHIVRIVNRVPGFVLPCNHMKVTQDSSGITHVAFDLDRSPLVQYFVVMLCLGLVIPLVPIMRIRDPETLAVTGASYFFSAFSLRGIVSEQMKTFPTLFDCWILTSCMLMMFSLLWTATRLKPRGEGIREPPLKKPNDKKGESRTRP
jgi:hypothetical protein